MTPQKIPPGCRKPRHPIPPPPTEPLPPQPRKLIGPDDPDLLPLWLLVLAGLAIVSAPLMLFFIFLFGGNP